MGDLGLPGSVVLMPDDAPQKNLWEVRKAGLNIMMSLKGDGKPVSFIEDCAVPLEHLAEYTDALTQVFRKHGTQGHLVCPRLGRHAARAAHPGHAHATARPRCARIAEEASALVRKYKGAYSGEHGDGLCRGEWIQLAVRARRSTRPSREIKQPVRPAQPALPAAHRRSAAHGRHAADALSARATR